MKNGRYLILGLAAIVCAVVLGRAYTYKFRAQDTIVVTGLGETEFTSDLIVWSGALTAESQDAATGYARIEANKEKVRRYLVEKGVPEEAVVFEFVNVEKLYTPIYNANGNWAGQRFTGYGLRQRFTVESRDVETVERVSREISSLIAQGVSIEAYAPDYYYTQLDDVKMGLIETASADARMRPRRSPRMPGRRSAAWRRHAWVSSRSRAPTPTRSSRPAGRSTPRRARRRPASPCASSTGSNNRTSARKVAPEARQGPDRPTETGMPGRDRNAGRGPTHIRTARPSRAAAEKTRKAFNIQHTIWKDPFGCASHPAPPDRCTSAASARHSTTTSSPASTRAR